MSQRTIRVTVRGAFADLTGDQRAALVAGQAAHDFLHTVYTPEGHLTYDLSVRPNFAFRFALEAAEEKDIPTAATEAELAAITWLDEHGYAYKDVKVQTVDMSQVPLGARGRKRDR
ncbi:DUF6204 family protein [Actinoplanes sp. NPDC049265]|uniref:DUF6204 family protein n=1 Tax=Actinoplanes sp. NPDC049265 TaxID=3363902 RepID=UPI003723ACCA